MLGWLALAASLSALVLLPVLWPYREVLAEQGLRRSLADVAQLSASPWSYLVTTARVHYTTWSHLLFQRVSREVLFPGLIGASMTIVALTLGLRGAHATRIRMCLAIGVVGFVMSLGTATPVYAWAYNLFPPLQGMRAAVRFGSLVMLAVAALGGLGLAALRRARPGRRWMTGLAIGLIAVANIESFHPPFRYVRFEGIPSIYQRLAREPGSAVLVEVPLYTPSFFHLNAKYLLASTAHWKPLLNGYGGFMPASYRELAQIMEGFPAPRTIAALRDRDVEYIMLHVADYRRPGRGREVVAMLDRRPDVQLLETDDGGRRLYRLGSRPSSVDGGRSR